MLFLLPSFYSIISKNLLFFNSFYILMLKLFYFNIFTKNPTKSFRSFFIPFTSDGIFLFYSLWQESSVILCHRRFFHTRSTTVEQPCRQLLSAHGYAGHYLHACCLTPTSKSSPVPALLTAAAPRDLTHTDVSDLPAPLTYRFYPMEFPAW